MWRPEPRARPVAIALHDVSPATWLLCERLLQMVSSFGRGIPLTLLVVPDWHRELSIADAYAWRRLVDRYLDRGCELALHGLHHLDEGGPSRSLAAWTARRVLSAREAEFAALDRAEACRRIESGVALLRECGWQAPGFVPPAWQISREARAALAYFDFEYTTTLGSLFDLRNEIRWRVPCLTFSARSPWRRALSVRWAAWGSAQLSHTRALRIALHPLDARYDSTLAAWRRLLHHVLRTSQPVTKSTLCRTLARDSRPLCSDESPRPYLHTN